MAVSFFFYFVLCVVLCRFMCHFALWIEIFKLTFAAAAAVDSRFFFRSLGADDVQHVNDNFRSKCYHHIESVSVFFFILPFFEPGFCIFIMLGSERQDNALERARLLFGERIFFLKGS